MSKPWGGIGSWAAEAEREEAEEKRDKTTTSTTTNPQTFPSLQESIKKKPKKKAIPFSEFVLSTSSGSTRLTHDELLQLPTAPKPRTSDEEFSGSRLGGGFSNYGDDRRSSRRAFDDDRKPRRGDFDSMPPPPSLADEVDNWGSMKKNISMETRTSGSGGGGSRYGSLGGGSRADEVGNWSFGKKLNPGPAVMGGNGSGGGRLNNFGSGFRDSGSDWRRGGGGDRESGLGRPKLVLDPPTGRNGENGEEGVKKVNKANPFGAARPREEVLAEKGLDWKKLDLEIEAKKVLTGSGSRPTSSQGSRPTSSQSNRSESVGEVRSRPKLNPFGDAKPREVLLEEKGLDWRKIDLDLDHRRIDRPESEEEKLLKEEIENLKKELEKESGNDVSMESKGEQISLHDLIQSKERDLEALVRDLDNKFRSGQKAVERPSSRPSSGAGRFTIFPERPPSQSGSYDDVRGPEVMDRPQSRGSRDIWTRPGEDRRGGFQGYRDRGGFQGNSYRGGFQGNRDGGGFQGNRDRGGFQGGRDRGGFLGNRDFERSSSGDRW
ncbi:eukaryotic translation initiation factor 4B1 [Amaranthus tricolor]|uniref:eukaryotic translation initiation factor 4B1 n=1 Tax=Amaranthus tricolor TaxID=29722 RepID=UPI002584613D|nr:eukaryotic translation initiation factor 4B1 [Amaranthus tricolor]